MNFFKDYLPIPKDIESEVKIACKNQGTKLILVTRNTLHPDDSYLYVVLAKRLDNKITRPPYVVWLYNSSVGGLGSGAYDLTLSQALQVFSSRLY